MNGVFLGTTLNRRTTRWGTALGLLLVGVSGSLEGCATRVDFGPPNDASAAGEGAVLDGGLDSGADSGSPCSLPHDFCADFDSPALTKASMGFDVELGSTSNGGAVPTFGKPGSPALSAPRALETSLVDDKGGGQHYSYVTKAVTPSNTPAETRPRLAIEFDFFVAAESEAPQNAFIFKLKDPNVALFLVRREGTTTCWASDESTNNQQERGTITIGSWVHVAIRVAPRDAAGVAAGVKPDVTVACGAAAMPFKLPQFFPPTATVNFQLGLETGSASGRWNVYYDNVTMDWK